MATVVVDQAKLVLNTFAAIFQNNLLAADLVEWNTYNGEMNDRNGLTVVEQVGPRYQVTQTTSGVQDLSAGVQDTVFGSEQFTVNQVFGSSMGWGDFVKIRDIGDARESVAIRNAATQLAEKIDAYILQRAVMFSNNWTGTAGNAVNDWDDILNGYTRLKEEGVDDSDLRCVLTYGDKQALGSEVIDYPAPDGLVTGVFRKGFTGEVGGIPTMFTQQLSQHTNGNDVTGVQVNGATQNVDYSDVAISGAPGQYTTQLINIDGLTNTTGTVAAGSVFTIANVNAWDSRLGQTLGRLQQFTVVTGGTANGSGQLQIRIFPAIIVQGSGSGGDIAVNNSFATVDSVPADDAALTFMGSASTAYKPRVIIQKEAVVVSTRDLIMPATGIGSRKSLTKVPLSVRMWQDSVFATGEHRVRFDVALTANVRDRRRIVRINGN